VEGGCRGEAKHPRVPEESAAGYVFLGSVEWWFLDEAHDVVALAFDVAVAGFCDGGADAEGDDSAPARAGVRFRGCFDEGGEVGDQVVGGRTQQHGFRAEAFVRREGGGGNGGGRISALRLQDETQWYGIRVDRGVFVGCLEVQVAVGYGENFAYMRQCCG